ncbi:biotin transporter BioY [Roseobacter sp. HKCCD9010]|uniref:biotin transporter BioY n=1 Tax=unclassified Roseobacter TaxID=196798 RepID=UPI001491D926|nr:MULTISPECIES: biotin transporter BioY [unclassified Roseobacter]MBF9049985.1 biotin transporter BioY [Rhodobacterales bacterium HKCCD4356]NNV12228.1 biotin transporter BioY [Roseobacter sp. HKCCD7357]NNV16309.1 biotin transporter BioY [Roseobacter sp. HKCCD8768]NNV25769.1 biotin transporter BioY [Roseobacter sp. HKCCD8192]NNV30025.1 biotin transporter BioY [Roseobacter sp. HKCCD9061]
MSRDTTLSQAALGTDGIGRKALLVLGGTLFIAVAAKISVPMLPVPMSLQTLAILIVGFAFGSRLGAVTLLAYLTQGAMGLPVFTPTTAPGLLAFAGPTAGFLIGFVGMAYLAGLAAERGLARGVISTALVAIAISALLYIPGVAWPMAVASAFGVEAGWVGLSAAPIWANFVAPFLLGDVIKSVLVALIVTGAWRALARR